MVDIVQVREALARVDHASERCPVRMSTKFIETCTRCGAGPSQGCGLNDSATNRFIDEMRALVAGGEEVVETQSARIAELEAALNALHRCYLPIFMTMAEQELIDGAPVPDDAVILSFMGSGASDYVTAKELRAAGRAAIAALTGGPANA